MMEVSPAGLDFIKSWEQLRLKAYQDSGGVWTIGWGHTGPDVTAGKILTAEEAHQILIHDVAVVVSMLRKMGVPHLQPEFDALASFIFNIGVSAFQTSTLRKLLIAGDKLGAAAEFPKWHKDNGKRVKGLLSRRLCEALLFLGEKNYERR